MSQGNTTVILVDDHLFVRAGVRALLERTSDIVVVGEAENSSTAIDKIKMLTPDVAVLDLQLPDANGAEACRAIASASPKTNILVLSAFLNPYLLRTCLDQGACGYLLKDAENLDIANAIRIVATGGTVFDKRVRTIGQQVLGIAHGFEMPTPRELQVLILMGKGLTNQEIAECLSVSLNTVKGHIKEIMRKLHCHNRVEVVVKGRGLYLI